MRGGRTTVVLLAGMVASSAWCAGSVASSDPRLREVVYDPGAVVTVPVKRGVVTHVVLDAREAITEVAAGLGGDCAKADAAWCIAAQPGGRHLYVKPKSTASAPNTLAVVTDQRMHSFRFVVLGDGDARSPIYRLVVKAPVAPSVASPRSIPDQAALLQALTQAAPTPPAPTPRQIVEERLQAKPQVLNASYSVAEGKASEDIVPTMVYDDGRFTYLKFPGNREVPAVFHVLGDGSETLLNARMEDDVLVVDRVSRRLMLRAGSAVVGVWNDAYDLDGVPPQEGTTVPGVRRQMRTVDGPTAPPARKVTAGDARSEVTP